MTAQGVTLRSLLLGLLFTLAFASCGKAQESVPPAKRTTANLGVIEQLYFVLNPTSEAGAITIKKKSEKLWWESFTLNQLSKRRIEVDTAGLGVKFPIPLEPVRFQEFAKTQCGRLLTEPWSCDTSLEKVATYQKAVELSIYLHWYLHDVKKDADDALRKLIAPSALAGEPNRYKRYWVKQLLFAGTTKAGALERRQQGTEKKGRIAYNVDVANACDELAKAIANEGDEVTDQDVFKDYIDYWSPLISDPMSPTKATVEDLLANAPLEFHLVYRTTEKWDLREDLKATPDSPLVQLANLFNEKDTKTESIISFLVENGAKLGDIQKAQPAPPRGSGPAVAGVNPVVAGANTESPKMDANAIVKLLKDDPTLRKSVVAQLPTPAVDAEGVTNLLRANEELKQSVLEKLAPTSAPEREKQFVKMFNDFALEVRPVLITKIAPDLSVAGSSLLQIQNKLGTSDDKIMLRAVDNALKLKDKFKAVKLDFASPTFDEDLKKIDSPKPANDPNAEALKELPAYKDWIKQHPNDQLTKETVTKTFAGPSATDIQKASSAAANQALIDLVKETAEYKEWQAKNPGQPLPAGLVRTILQGQTMPAIQSGALVAAVRDWEPYRKWIAASQENPHPLTSEELHDLLAKSGEPREISLAWLESVKGSLAIPACKSWLEKNSESSLTPETVAELQKKNQWWPPSDYKSLTVGSGLSAIVIIIWLWIFNFMSKKGKKRAAQATSNTSVATTAAQPPGKADLLGSGGNNMGSGGNNKARSKSVGTHLNRRGTPPGDAGQQTEPEKKVGFLGRLFGWGAKKTEPEPSLVDSSALTDVDDDAANEPFFAKPPLEPGTTTSDEAFGNVPSERPKTRRQYEDEISLLKDELKQAKRVATPVKGRQAVPVAGEDEIESLKIVSAERDAAVTAAAQHAAKVATLEEELNQLRQREVVPPPPEVTPTQNSAEIAALKAEIEKLHADKDAYNAETKKHYETQVSEYLDNLEKKKAEESAAMKASLDELTAATVAQAAQIKAITDAKAAADREKMAAAARAESLAGQISDIQAKFAAVEAEKAAVEAARVKAEEERADLDVQKQAAEKLATKTQEKLYDTDAKLAQAQKDHQDLLTNKYTAFPAALEAGAEALCRVIEKEAKNKNANARNLQGWMGALKAMVDALETPEKPQELQGPATTILREMGRELIAMSADAPHVTEKVAELLNPGLEKLWLQLMVPTHGQMVNRDFMSPAGPGTRVNAVVCWGVIAQVPGQHPSPLHRAEVTAF